MINKFIICFVLTCWSTKSVSAMDENLTLFLNPAASVQARAQAGQKIGFVEDDGELGELEAFLNANAQPNELRAIALQKLGDSKPIVAFKASVDLLRNRETPEKLRVACAGFIARTTQFGELDPEYRQAASQVMLDVLKMEEPESVRTASLSYLLKVGDQHAEEMLRNSISSGGGIVGQEKAVGYAASSDPRKYESELSSLLANAEKPSVKARVVEALASNPEYQLRIKNLLENKEESLEVRIAAVDSLIKYMPKLAVDAIRIAEDQEQPVALRTACLYQVSGTATRLSGNAILWQSAGLNKDDLTIAVRNIGNSALAPEQVKDAAAKYLEMRSNE